MPGMSGEEEEQPASNNAVARASVKVFDHGLEAVLHSKTIATAIKIIKT